MAAVVRYGNRRPPPDVSRGVRSTFSGRSGPLLALYACLAAVACLSAQPPAPALLAAVLVGLVAVAVARHGAPGRGPVAARVRVWAVSLHRRAQRTAFLPVRDPAAAGRPRPRAPSVDAPAA